MYAVFKIHLYTTYKFTHMITHITDTISHTYILFVSLFYVYLRHLSKRSSDHK